MSKRVKEVWKPIDKVGGIYHISNLGRVKSIERMVWNGTGYRRVKEKIRKTFINSGGYVFISVKYNGGVTGIYIHCEMAKAFIPNKHNKPQVNHKDGNPSNCSLDNLEWVTISENIQHSYDCLDHKGQISVVYKGEKVKLRELCKNFGIPIYLARDRIKRGWTLEDALSILPSKYTHKKITK